MVFLTASVAPALNRTAFAAGAVACVTKPFQRDAMLAVVNATLHGVAGRGERNGAQAGATTTLRKPSGPESIVEFLDKRVDRTRGVPRL